MPQTILLDVDGPVATITLNRPEVLNAINDDFRDELNRIVGLIVEHGQADHARTPIGLRRGASGCQNTSHYSA